MNRLLSLCLLLPALMLLSAGCGEDDITAPVQEPTFDPPSSAIMLMQMFATAYTDMDLDLYGNLLHDDFRFFFIHAQDGYFDREDDLISTGNMFSSEAGINSQGYLTRAINSIDVDQMLLVEPWADVDPDDPDFGSVDGAQEALYQCRLVLYHNEGTITLQEPQVFYAAPAGADGETTWSLLGQRDTVKANENTTWGNLKVLFR